MALDLPPDLAKVAREQLNEDPATRHEVLAELRLRLEQLPEGQRPYRLDDAFLVAYLRGTKFRVELAAKKILALEAFRREHPEWVKVRGLGRDELLWPGRAGDRPQPKPSCGPASRRAEPGPPPPPGSDDP
jgi:hypothetical protein